MSRAGPSRRPRPSADAPVVNREQPRAPWADKKLNYELSFPLTDAFDTLPTTSWAVAELTHRRLQHICAPLARVAYPRVVRLFYQNLQCLEEPPISLTTSIDGTSYTFTMTDIIQVSGCPIECPDGLLPRTGHQLYDLVDDVTVEQVAAAICTVNDSSRPRTYIRKSNLPERVWFIDSVFKHNVCPLVHSTERRDLLLQALYAMDQDKWFSIPDLIWHTFMKFWNDAHNARLQRAENRKLPLPFFITRLLRHKGFIVPPHEPKGDKIKLFTQRRWINVLSHSRHPQSAAPLSIQASHPHLSGDAPRAAAAERIENPIDSQQDQDFIRNSFAGVYARMDRFESSLSEYSRVLSETSSRAEEDRRLAEDERRLAEDERRLAEDERRLAAEDRRLAAEERRLAQADRRKTQSLLHSILARLPSGP